MDKYIKQSIDTRKQAINAAYTVDATAQKKIDKLFDEIETLGASCQDVGDFEAKLASSPLNQQYLDLFTEIATSAPAKVSAPKISKSEIGKMVAKGTATGVAESATDQAINQVVPTRAAVNQEPTDAVRKTPVIGDAMDIAEKAGYAAHLGKLFRRKKDKK